jgi:WD repeat-containing protein 22
LWKVPEPSTLIKQRQEVSQKNWDIQADTTAFAENLMATRYIPVDLSTPVYRLTGMLLGSCILLSKSSFIVDRP